MLEVSKRAIEEPMRKVRELERQLAEVGPDEDLERDIHIDFE